MGKLNDIIETISGRQSTSSKLESKINNVISALNKIRYKNYDAEFKPDLANEKKEIRSLYKRISDLEDDIFDMRGHIESSGVLLNDIKTGLKADNLAIINEASKLKGLINLIEVFNDNLNKIKENK